MQETRSFARKTEPGSGTRPKVTESHGRVQRGGGRSDRGSYDRSKWRRSMRRPVSPVVRYTTRAVAGSRHRTGTDSPLPSHNRPAQGRDSTIHGRASRIPDPRSVRSRPTPPTHNCPVSTDSTLMHDAAQRYKPLSPCSQPHTTQARARMRASDNA